MLDRIGAIKRIEKVAPTGIRSVQRIARVGQRDHELGPGNPADLLVDIGSVDLYRRGLRVDINNLLQKAGVGIDVERLLTIPAMPFVDFALQTVPYAKQLGIARRQIANDYGSPP
jgi:hypothetical protein